MNILNLDAFDTRSVAVDELDGQYHISVQSNQLPRACPQCGSLRELYRFGGREREFFDLLTLTRQIQSVEFSPFLIKKSG